jgi:hypothetical protein
VKYLLVLDVGVTTGYSHWRGEDLFDYGSVSLEGLEKYVKNAALYPSPLSFSVAERPVIIRGKLGDQLQEAISIVDRVLMRQVEWISHSDWKSHPLAKSLCPRGTSQHEKDAIRIGRWWLKTRH